ncbi:MAG: hypothetical protein B7X67_09830 [Rhizobiales bacterium 39-66-18]|nr:MAG: hypothetical protein B7X67_09830 [Rhizobiales bacterium 39-66-18]
MKLAPAPTKKPLFGTLVDCAFAPPLGPIAASAPAIAKTENVLFMRALIKTARPRSPYAAQSAEKSKRSNKKGAMSEDAALKQPPERPPGRFGPSSAIPNPHAKLKRTGGRSHRIHDESQRVPPPRLR